MTKSGAGAALVALLGAAGLAGCEQSNPTRLETAAPRVVSVSPAPGATEVWTTTTITVTFSRPVDPRSVVVLVNGLVRGPISVDDSIVTLTLDHRLFQQVEYTAAVPAGVADLSGTRMDSAYVWTFTTGFGPLGEEWSPEASRSTAALHAVTRGAIDFLAVGERGTLLTSPDGRTWTQSAFRPAADRLHAAFSVGDRFVVAASPASMIASSDPVNWSEYRLPDSVAHFYDLWVAFDGIYLVGTGGPSGTDGIVVKYRSPADWSLLRLGPGLVPRSITGFGGGFVVVGDSGLVFTSTDGNVWTDRSLGRNWGTLAKVRYVALAGQLVAVGSAILTSPDGISWTERTAKSASLLRDVTWTTLNVSGATHALYCAVGDGGRIMTSANLAAWILRPSGITADLYGIARGLVPARFVAVGAGGVIFSSE